MSIGTSTCRTSTSAGLSITSAAFSTVAADTLNWDLRVSMTEADIEVILERGKELHPKARPRIISDNGPQFIAKDFKEFIGISAHDPHPNFARLSSIERKNRTLA